MSGTVAGLLAEQGIKLGLDDVSVPSADTPLTEGLADYARYKYGVNNAAAGWSLPNYASGQSYTNAYAVTARFLVWLELRVRSTLRVQVRRRVELRAVMRERLCIGSRQSAGDIRPMILD